MSKRRALVIVIAAAVVMWVGVLVFGVFREREPEYGGKRLSEWVEMPISYLSRKAYLPLVSETFWFPPRFDARDPADAIERIGTNALPYLIEMIRYEPPSWKPKMLAIMTRTFHRKFEDRRALRSEGAVAAISILRSGADVAIPALALLMNDDRQTNTANRATWALLDLAGEVLAADAALMTNHSASIRRVAIRIATMQFRSRIGPAVPAVARCLMDSDEGTAVRAARLLGNWTLDPELVVPALKEGLKDHRPAVLSSVIAALAQFPMEARSAVPALRELSKNPDPEIKTGAANALTMIDIGQLISTNAYKGRF